jgi:hypothetical protein
MNDEYTQGAITALVGGIAADRRLLGIYEYEAHHTEDMLNLRALLFGKGWEDPGLNDDELFLRFSREARNLIRDENVWGCIEALASELLEKEELNGKEAVQIIVNNWKGELPEMVRPLEEHGIKKEDQK